MKRSNFKMTPQHLYHLRAARAQNLTLAEAIKELGVGLKVFRREVRKAGMVNEVHALFPQFGRNERPENEFRGYRVIDAEDLHHEPVKVPANFQAQALAKPWRIAA